MLLSLSIYSRQMRDAGYSIGCEYECEYEHPDLKAVPEDADTSDCGFQQFMTRPVILHGA